MCEALELSIDTECCCGSVKRLPSGRPVALLVAGVALVSLALGCGSSNEIKDALAGKKGLCEVTQGTGNFEYGLGETFDVVMNESGTSVTLSSNVVDVAFGSETMTLTFDDKAKYPGDLKVEDGTATYTFDSADAGREGSGKFNNEPGEDIVSISVSLEDLKTGKFQAIMTQTQQDYGDGVGIFDCQVA